MESREIVKDNDFPERYHENMSRRQFLKTTSVAVLTNILDGNIGQAVSFLEKTIGTDGEKEKNSPEISVDVFYAPHDTAEDLKGLSEKLRGSDVFVPEMIGWNEKYKKDFSEVASGKMTPEQFFKEHELNAESGHGRFESHERSMVKMIYNSGKHIDFFDIARGNPLALRIVLNLQKIYSPELHRDFPGIVASFKESIKEFSELQIEREKHILSIFFEFRDNFVRGGIPDLKDKKNLKILLSMGGVHTGLYHAFSRSGTEANREFFRKPYIYPYFSEIVRRNLFGKEVSDELAARTLAEIFVSFAMKLDSLSPDTNKKGAFARKIISQFTFDEIRELFGKLQKVGHERVPVLKVILSVFREKGIKIPKTEAEFNLMI